MKKHSFLVLLICSALCVALAIVTYIAGGITEDLTDIISYRQSGNAGKITNDNKITQSFLCTHNHVKGLIFRISTLGNTYDKAEAVLSLKDEKGIELVSQTIPLAGKKDKSSFAFEFEPLTGVQGQVLTLEASAKGLEGEQVYSLMMGQGSVGGTLTTADGKSSDKNSLYMTVNYENEVKAMAVVYIFLIGAAVCVSLAPMAAGKKGGC